MARPRHNLGWIGLVVVVAALTGGVAMLIHSRENDFTVKLQTLERHPPVNQTDLRNLATSYAWLPRAYIDCLHWSNGVEGYVGGRGYLRMWPARSAIELNAAYHVAEFLPTAFLFGTNAAGIGYLFDRRRPEHVLSVELNAMDDDYLTDVAVSLGAFVHQLATEGPEPEGLQDHLPPNWLRGQVLHQKLPVILGGSPEDPDNRVIVPEEKHPELAVFWTRTVRSARARAKTSQE